MREELTATELKDYFFGSAKIFTSAPPPTTECRKDERSDDNNRNQESFLWLSKKLSLNYSWNRM
jgi:hypothetical protein